MTFNTIEPSILSTWLNEYWLQPIYRKELLQLRISPQVLYLIVTVVNMYHQSARVLWNLSDSTDQSFIPNRLDHKWIPVESSFVSRRVKDYVDSGGASAMVRIIRLPFLLIFLWPFGRQQDNYDCGTKTRKLIWNREYLMVFLSLTAFNSWVRLPTRHSLCYGSMNVLHSLAITNSPSLACHQPVHPPLNDKCSPPFCNNLE